MPPSLSTNFGKLGPPPPTKSWIRLCIQTPKALTKKGILIAKNDNKVPIRIINLQDREVHLFRRTRLALFETTSENNYDENQSAILTCALDAGTCVNSKKDTISGVLASAAIPGTPGLNYVKTVDRQSRFRSLKLGP